MACSPCEFTPAVTLPSRRASIFLRRSPERWLVRPLLRHDRRTGIVCSANDPGGYRMSLWNSTRTRSWSMLSVASSVSLAGCTRLICKFVISLDWWLAHIWNSATFLVRLRSHYPRIFALRPHPDRRMTWVTTSYLAGWRLRLS